MCQNELNHNCYYFLPCSHKLHINNMMLTLSQCFFYFALNNQEPRLNKLYTLFLLLLFLLNFYPFKEPIVILVLMPFKTIYHSSRNIISSLFLFICYFHFMSFIISYFHCYYYYNFCMFEKPVLPQMVQMFLGKICLDFEYFEIRNENNFEMHTFRNFFSLFWNFEIVFTVVKQRSQDKNLVRLLFAFDQQLI